MLIDHTQSRWTNPSGGTGAFRRPADAKVAELERQVGELQAKLQLANKRIAELEAAQGVRKVAAFIDEQGRELISQAEAARVLKVHQWQIHRWVNQKKLCFVDVPGRCAPMIVREGLERPAKGRRERKAA